MKWQRTIVVIAVCGLLMGVVASTPDAAKPGKNSILEEYQSTHFGSLVIEMRFIVLMTLTGMEKIIIACKQINTIKEEPSDIALALFAVVNQQLVVKHMEMIKETIALEKICGTSL